MPKAPQHHALARQWQLLRLLPTNPPGITARELAALLAREGFTVTKRTVERDLSELSSLFGIACNDKGTPYGWHWMKGKYADLPGLAVSDALSLRIIEELLRPLLPPAVLDSMESRFEQAQTKLATLRPDNPTARWEEKVRYIPPGLPLMPPAIAPGILESVQQALLEERQLQVRYRKPGGTESSDLLLHPLALIQRGPVPYLAAAAYDYSDIRLYAVHRMQACEFLAEAAALPPDFSLDAFIARGALQFGEPEPIRLTAWVAPDLAAILSETPLGGDQQLAPAPEGYRLQVSVSDTWQLEWWLLSQGDSLRVDTPPGLRERIRERLSQALGRYTDGNGPT